ncbi:RNA polymerase sigma factor [Nitrolancea hollandica]|uniref:RNA polymerase, sigma-24 subunit, ECF subfamily n=1 Tax=Nitrolancea hollandica Lb TaxID=1129897 RepID=I4ED10_9BACT|nr:RNA polymerase sigma factor [Nitrolancea hollandica]CCF82572.1 RNA polymerase, sigma-24 subunit, ECF subfamily [Nitrolancea hollandica Lb]
MTHGTCETSTDAEIIVVSQSDPRQFGAIFDRHFDAIHRYLSRRVGESIADDLAAQTFTEAFAHRERYDVDQPDSRPWLYGIASNLLRRYHRTEVRQLRAYARSGIDPDIDPDLEAVAERLDAGDAGPRIAAALATLNHGDREVLLLYAWADLSYLDISHALDIPIGTVRSRLNRARRVMREQLGQIGQYQEEDHDTRYPLETTDGRS